MSRQKQIRRRGKISLSEYFKELKIGDKVSISKEFSLPVYFPRRIQGLSGEIIAKRGESYIIKLNQGNKEKQFIVEAAHLKKLK